MRQPNHEPFVWKLLDKYFDGPNAKYKLTQHHLQSYSDFIRYRIPTIMQDFNSWTNSEVFNGTNVRKKDTDVYTGNPNARAHVFVGMNVQDVYQCAHGNGNGNGTTAVSRPTRIQLRHQILEYSKLPNKPVRYITPNEARLRNLNYQHELVAEVTIMHHCALDKKERELTAREFAQLCTDKWNKHHKHIATLLEKRKLPNTIAELPDFVKPCTSAVVQYIQKHAKLSKPEVANALQRFVQNAMSKHEGCDAGVNYLSRMLGVLACPHISVFEDVVIAKIPLMLHSPFCILHNQPDAFLRDVGECIYEKGGYFIVHGKEKVIISQESYRRNVIQTRAQTVTAPTNAIPVTTHILHKGESTPVENGQEEVFEATIECANDPQPPVKVVLQYKRMPYYHTGGELDYDDIKKHQLGVMRKNLPFNGLYISVYNRKGSSRDSRKSRENAILYDVPLFLLFRAMGVTDASHSSKEQLSDRDILECILGYDTSGIQKTTVPLTELRRMCATEKKHVRTHTKCWYTPNGEGDCMWLSFDKTIKLKEGARLPVTFKQSKTYKATSIDCTVVRVQNTHVLVRLPASVACWPFDAAHETVLAMKTAAIASPCRYARRFRATVRDQTATHCTIAYQTHTLTQHSYDPILHELLLPSIQEGAFAVNRDIARDMLQRMVNIDALDDQDEAFAELHRRGVTEKMDAVFRSLFTHIKPNSTTTATMKKEVLLRKKQLFLGYMTKRLLFAYLGLDERNTSRDSYKLRRVQLSGEMLSDVFRYEYFQLQNKYKEYVRNGMKQQGLTGAFKGLFLDNVVRTNLFDANYMTERLQKSFMGKWGSKVADDADQKAYCQELIRLSYYGSLAYLRRVHKELPSTSKPGQKKGTSKAVGPRLLHASQYGMICPVETPDGGNIGKIKHLTTFAFVCPQMPPEDVQQLMQYVHRFAKPAHAIDAFHKIGSYHKVIVDGDWSYVCPETCVFENKPIHQQQLLSPDRFVRLLRLLRRNGLLSPLVSVSWDVARKEIFIHTQEGRVTRPLLIVEHNTPLFAPSHHNSDEQDWLWEELLSGRPVTHQTQRADKRPLYHDLSVKFELPDKVPRHTTQDLLTTMDQLSVLSGVMEYIDTCEIDRAMLAMHPHQLHTREAFYHAWNTAHPSPERGAQNTHRATGLLVGNSPLHYRVSHATDRRQLHSVLHALRRQSTPQMHHFTHSELHPSLMLGIMGMLIPFPEHSPAPRNQYSCHQSKQALGLYVSAFRKRLDHANHILHYPEKALTGSRYSKYFNNEKLNYGTNVIVAIMCYGGFNIEDAVLFNKASVDRGLFQSTYYYTEEVTEKDAQNEKVYIGRNMDIKRAHNRHNYDLIDLNTRKQGIIPPSLHNRHVQKHDVLIEAYEEKREPSGEGRSYTDYKRDASKDGYVEHVFLSDDVRGRRVAKVTLRNIRTPVIGDKFASRSGQKGTLGALVEEEDMPFIGNSGTGFLDGIRPDIILNPHAIPSRMTLGQLLESLSGVIGTQLGRMADSTPLCGDATTSPVDSLMHLMRTLGLNAHGNQTMYNGNTGAQLTGQVFVGPTYYQRLKQMPEDKYYHRRTGRADMVTRQPIAGRAQGGALKFGEMERDSLLAHGISQFTKEAFNEKSDGFQYHVSRNTGTVHPPKVSGKVDYDHFTPVRRSMDFLSGDDAGGFKEYLSNETDDVTDYKAHSDVVQNETLRTNEPVSKVNVPFATRLLSQECEAMGVGMRMMAESSEPVDIRCVNSLNAANAQNG